MGYRSDVAMCIEGTAVPALLAAVRMDPEMSKQAAERLDEVVVTEDGIYLAFQDTKWYSDYDDVRWYERLYSMAEDMSEGSDGTDGVDLSGLFMRIGEETGDIEERYFGEPDWDKMQIRRAIDLDGPFEWR